MTIHKKGILTITKTKNPVLQGCKRNGANLWIVPTQTLCIGQEEAASVYSLSSMGQTIKYLHTAAGYPVEETWTKAINAGNYNTWPGLTTATVRKHPPESDETQKGHMKRQQQGVQSTRVLQTIMEEDENEPESELKTYSVLSIPPTKCNITDAKTKEDAWHVHQDP